MKIPKFFKSGFFLFLVRTWLLIKAIQQAEPGETFKELKTQLDVNKNLRKAKKQQDKETKINNIMHLIIKQIDQPVIVQLAKRHGIKLDVVRTQQIEYSHYLTFTLQARPTQEIRFFDELDQTGIKYNVQN